MKRGQPPRRRRPLNRGTSQLARTPLNRGAGLGRSGRLAPGRGPAPRSARRVGEQVERRGLVADRLLPCDLGPAIRRVVPGWDGCSGRFDAWHERRKAGAAGSRTNPRNLVAACVPCNEWVEDEPDLARQVVLADGRSAVIREGDPDWEAMSRRQDR